MLALAVGQLDWRPLSTPSQSTAAVATVNDKLPTNDKLATTPRFSIVVLPFENLSGDPGQQYFADALADDLTSCLSQLKGFEIARNTAIVPKDKPVDASGIGRELGVRYAIEGVGETVTVNAQLISTETGAQIWADRFEGERSQLGQWQEELVARLANVLGVEPVKTVSLPATRERGGGSGCDPRTDRGSACKRYG